MFKVTSITEVTNTVICFWLIFRDKAFIILLRGVQMKMSHTSHEPSQRSCRKHCDKDSKFPTCADMSISLFSFSFFPSSVFRKSRRHPANENRRTLSPWVMTDNIITGVLLFRGNFQQLVTRKDIWGILLLGEGCGLNLCDGAAKFQHLYTIMQIWPNLLFI